MFEAARNVTVKKDSAHDRLLTLCLLIGSDWRLYITKTLRHYWYVYVYIHVHIPTIRRTDDDDARAKAFRPIRVPVLRGWHNHKSPPLIRNNEVGKDFCFFSFKFYMYHIHLGVFLFNTKIKYVSRECWKGADFGRWKVLTYISS